MKPESYSKGFTVKFEDNDLGRKQLEEAIKAAESCGIDVSAAEDRCPKCSIVIMRDLAGKPLPHGCWAEAMRAGGACCKCGCSTAITYVLIRGVDYLCGPCYRGDR